MCLFLWGGAGPLHNELCVFHPSNIMCLLITKHGAALEFWR